MLLPRPDSPDMNERTKYISLSIEQKSLSFVACIEDGSLSKHRNCLVRIKSCASFGNKNAKRYRIGLGN